MSIRMMFVCRACKSLNDTTDKPAVAKCGTCQTVHYTPEQAARIESVLAAITTCPCGVEHEIGDRCSLESFVDYIIRKLDELVKAANSRREAKGMLAWEGEDPLTFAGGIVGEA